jgi:hypothetical protein
MFLDCSIECSLNVPRARFLTDLEQTRKSWDRQQPERTFLLSTVTNNLPEAGWKDALILLSGEDDTRMSGEAGMRDSSTAIMSRKIQEQQDDT